MKKIIRILPIIIGSMMLLYPWIGNWLYDHAVRSQAAGYEKALIEKTETELQNCILAAQNYNCLLYTSCQGMLTGKQPGQKNAVSNGCVFHSNPLQMDQHAVQIIVRKQKICENFIGQKCPQQRYVLVPVRSEQFPFLRQISRITICGNVAGKI